MRFRKLVFFVSKSRHFCTQGREIVTAMVSAIGSLVDMKMVRNIVDGVVERMRDRHGSTDPEQRRLSLSSLFFSSRDICFQAVGHSALSEVRTVLLPHTHTLSPVSG